MQKRRKNFNKVFPKHHTIVRSPVGAIFETICSKYIIMDSINKNQEEENRKDLFGEEAVQKMKELVEKANSCFFCTKITSHESFSTRPMAVQKIDDDGYLWFLSASDSKKNEEITTDPMVQLLFQGSPYSDYITIYGSATISRDKAIIKELWKPLLKTWFTEGQNDERITVIKVVPSESYYWDTKHNMAIALTKRLIGAALGKTIDDSIEGQIRL
jgi:general stress protein 26